MSEQERLETMLEQNRLKEMSEQERLLTSPLTDWFGDY